MSYQVLARKWRPQNFDDVVFQNHVSKTLQNSIMDGRVYHAYLFSGPRGVGKTTMARILAKTLNCLEGPAANPCDKCENCLEIKAGNSFDVIEIDGASNRGIDDVRELREKVNFAPLKARYKIYIIDEVHMVTREAFNALLKTLEEPPAHVKFVFATTEIHRIPDTILSRCQKFFFKKIPVETIVGHLRHIVKNEKFKISDSSLYSIARASDGSMRDAQSLLDQVVSFSDSGEEINEDDALSILGIASIESYIRLLGFIADSDAVAVIDEIDRVVEMGGDLPRYVDGFIEAMRSVRLSRRGISLQSLLGMSKEEVSMIKGISDRFFDEELSVIFKIAIELQKNMKFSGNERINIEMALLDMASFKSMPSLSSILSRLDEGLLSGGSGVLNGERKGKGADKKTEPGGIKAPFKNQLSAEKGGPDNRDYIKEWQGFLNEISAGSSMLHFILKTADIKLLNDDFHINFRDIDENAHYKSMLDESNLRFIREGMSARLGRKINIITINSDKENGPVEAGKKMDKIKSVPAMKEVKDGGNPAVEKIKDIFHGQEVKKGE